jgi:hypothetical protein
MPTPWLQSEIQASAPIRVGEKRLMTFSRALVLRLPWLKGGLVWNRPLAVWVVSPDGQKEIVPIFDLTRRIQLAIFGTGAIAAGLIWMLYRPKHKERNP